MSSHRTSTRNMADDLDLGGDLFQEPEGFLPPPPESHFVTYERAGDPSEITLKLVGKSPLWGHLLWNAGKYTAQYLDKHAERLVTSKKVLELGAAAGLPSLISAVNNALRVVSTDYPDPDLLSHIQYNVDHCEGLDPKKVVVRGFIWGQDETQLCYDELTEEELPSEIAEDAKFDLIILSDLVFNHTEHQKLLTNCRRALKRSGVALVVFSPHRPSLLNDDLAFFTECENYDLKAEKIEQVNWVPMFEEDDETIEIRSRVYCYELHPQW